MFVPLSVFMLVVFGGIVCCQRPAVVNIGAIFTFNSVIGRAAKVAMEAAASDVNADQMILNGTELKLFMRDVKCNVFMGSIEGDFNISCLNLHFLFFLWMHGLKFCRILDMNGTLLMVFSNCNE